MRFGVEWDKRFYDSGNMLCLVMASGWLWKAAVAGLCGSLTHTLLMLGKAKRRLPWMKPRPEDRYQSCGINRMGDVFSKEVGYVHAHSRVHNICSHSGVWCRRCGCTGPNDVSARSATRTIPSHGPRRGRHDWARRYDGRRHDGPRHDGWGRDAVRLCCA